MLSSILRNLSSALLVLCFATSVMAATNTPVMNVSGAGSDYIFVYEGNDTTTYADLSALGNSIIGWSATCTSGSCTVGDVLYVSGVGGNGNDYLFLYTEDASGNTDYPVSGAWYSFTAPAAPTPVYGSTALTTAQQSRVDAALAAYNSGAGDTVEANIFGDENLVNIIQAGGVSYLNLAIAGNLNTFDSEQDVATGSHGYIEATITGDSNDVDILQKGRAHFSGGTGDKATILTITGDSNTVDIRQHGLGDKFLDLEITGDDHTASIFQNGAGNHSARVALDGSQPWNFDLTQKGATDQTYTLPHSMSDGASVSGTCAAVGGCNLTIVQQ